MQIIHMWYHLIPHLQLYKTLYVAEDDCFNYHPDNIMTKHASRCLISSFGQQEILLS